MPFAHGGPVGQGKLRSTPEDFQVDEDLGFEPDGEGEHVFLQLRKRSTNTLWLGARLAELAGVPRRDVGHAGLKDRHALTSQWFSVHLAGLPEPDWRALESAEVKLLRVARHRRKLRVGTLRGNRFRLLVRELNADGHALQARLQGIREAGMPNYFGEQRFGRGYANLHQVDELFKRRLGRVDRKLRGLLLSAARSQLFNEVLATRIAQGDWNRPIPGDFMNLVGRRAGFPLETLDADIQRRCAIMDIHPTGPLWGRGRSLVGGDALQLEQTTLAAYGDWRNGLEHVGLKQERRALRVPVPDLAWNLPNDDQLSLTFSLPAGSYATVLLRELLSC
ncbi:MAG: tRNA pseudouridine(13) synthase TruD [Gammaproteobacteria bacterium]|nr:tRNA pseudouridine(13) synthase TruD [Gammaproteobacteria bacterium]